ncbi:hypothetical protein IEQ34_011000 [Dendrobium chrysotoxum]|uniref:Uncharacterized protein n=1 Tax=Dendrobium chrysotoxum TaxID=161865 RepID=A0AAV7GXP0_DENCH|nr:hypothetical protein IEQ34_011000 [Dendrobium chrysotoxum]
MVVNRLVDADFLNGPIKSQSFRDALASPSLDAWFTDLKSTSYRGLPSLWIFKEEILALVAPLHFALVGFFPSRRPSLESIHSVNLVENAVEENAIVNVDFLDHNALPAAVNVNESTQVNSHVTSPILFSVGNAVLNVDSLNNNSLLNDSPAFHEKHEEVNCGAIGVGGPINALNGDFVGEVNNCLFNLIASPLASICAHMDVSPVSNDVVYIDDVAVINDFVPQELGDCVGVTPMGELVNVDCCVVGNAGVTTGHFSSSSFIGLDPTAINVVSPVGQLDVVPYNRDFEDSNRAMHDRVVVGDVDSPLVNLAFVDITISVVSNAELKAHLALSMLQIQQRGVIACGCLLSSCTKVADPVALHYTISPTAVCTQDLNTQMAGKLIFSLDRNLIVKGITSGNFIQFEMQFQDFKLSVDGEEMIDLSAGIRRNVPLVEITLGSGVDSPISEMEAVVTPLPTVSFTKEDKNQKSITMEELPSQLEIGSSSSSPTVSKASKNKMKNYLRRVRKKVVKARKTAEAKALKHVKSEANQKFIAPSTNPFPGGNHFHPSPVTQRREVIETRARSSIHLLDYYMARINQTITEQTPAPGLRPQVEGYDLSTLSDDVRSRFYTCPTISTREEEVSGKLCEATVRRYRVWGATVDAASTEIRLDLGMGDGRGPKDIDSILYTQIPKVALCHYRDRIKSVSYHWRFGSGSRRSETLVRELQRETLILEVQNIWSLEGAEQSW